MLAAAALLPLFCRRLPLRLRGREPRAHAHPVRAQRREANVPLVTVLRQFIEEGRPLEAAFSRARSFSMKMKRKGRFVPRGMVASEYAE